MGRNTGSTLIPHQFKCFVCPDHLTKYCAGVTRCSSPSNLCLKCFSVSHRKTLRSHYRLVHLLFHDIARLLMVFKILKINPLLITIDKTNSRYGCVIPVFSFNYYGQVPNEQNPANCFCTPWKRFPFVFVQSFISYRDDEIIFSF